MRNHSAIDTPNSELLRWLSAALLFWLAGCSLTKPPPPVPPARAAATRAVDRARVYSEGANWPAAVAAWKGAIDQFGLLNDLPNLAGALHNLARAQVETGQLQEARTNLVRASELNQQLDRRVEWWKNQVAILQVEARLDDTAGLQARFDQLNPIQSELKDPEVLGAYLNELGLWQRRQGDRAAAAASLARAEQQYASSGHVLGVATTLANQARLLEGDQDFAGAAEMWGRALTKFMQGADPSGITHALAGQGRNLVAAGKDLARAEELLARAAANYEILGDQKLLETTRHWLTQARAARAGVR